MKTGGAASSQVKVGKRQVRTGTAGKVKTGNVADKLTSSWVKRLLVGQTGQVDNVEWKDFRSSWVKAGQNRSRG